MLKNLFLRNFRNYREVTATFDPRVNILLGRNGQGKTNLLEALVLLCSSHSFRYGENETFLRQGSNESFLRAQAVLGDLEYELELMISPSRKQHQLNGKKISGSELHSLFHYVLFSPESLRSIKEGADQRRQLIDELLISVDKKNIHLIRDFKKALQTRNRILKDHLEGDRPKSETEALLESIGPTFFKLSTQLIMTRLEALKEIAPEFNNAMQKISQSSQIARIEYRMSGTEVIHFVPQDIHNLLQKRALELHQAELSSGTSLVGPHKHDVVFLYNENDSRFFCSQGQQRALILSFKMAQIVYHSRVHGAYPILMLDDVLSELDEEKRESLIHFLQEIKTQIFMTTTDLKITGDLASHDCRVIEIVDGQIR